MARFMITSFQFGPAYLGRNDTGVAAPYIFRFVNDEEGVGTPIQHCPAIFDSLEEAKEAFRQWFCDYGNETLNRNAEAWDMSRGVSAVVRI